MHASRLTPLFSLKWLLITLLAHCLLFLGYILIGRNPIHPRMYIGFCVVITLTICKASRNSNLLFVFSMLYWLFMCISKGKTCGWYLWHYILYASFALLFYIRMRKHYNFDDRCILIVLAGLSLQLIWETFPHTLNMFFLPNADLLYLTINYTTQFIPTILFIKIMRHHKFRINKLVLIIVFLVIVYATLPYCGVNLPIFSRTFTWEQRLPYATLYLTLSQPKQQKERERK